MIKRRRQADRHTDSERQRLINREKRTDWGSNKQKKKRKENISPRLVLYSLIKVNQ